MRGLILILVLINIFLFWYIVSNFDNESFVAFLNVGQGSSVLIYHPRLKILYDAGPYGLKTVREIQSLSKFYHRRIDLILISHSDKDHYGGIFDLMERYQIGAIIISPYFSSDSGYLKFLQLAKEKNIPLITLKANDKIETPFEKIFILHPDRRYKNDNQNSLVIKVFKNNKNFLLTGDIDQKIEKYLLSKYEKSIKADYLLIPHHGSKYSSDRFFLANFKRAVIQVGENRYGHPHYETIQKLNILHIPYWRTDLNGTLVVR
jgi:competence protein ComEC